MKAGLMVKVEGDPHEYVMARAPSSVEVTDVLNVVMQTGSSPEELGFGHLDPRLAGVLTQSSESVADSLQHLNIQDLAEDDERSHG